MARRKAPIENLVQIPGENSGPVWMDAVGNGYPEVRDAFTKMLRLAFPTVAIYDHKLPPAQRGAAKVPVIPDIKEFYPIGFMAPYVQMPPEVQAAVSSLYIEIGKAIRKACAEGNENGKNLLMGLARGTVTVSDFDASKSLRKDDE
jgi:hypothetical protein